MNIITLIIKTICTHLADEDDYSIATHSSSLSGMNITHNHTHKNLDNVLYCTLVLSVNDTFLSIAISLSLINNYRMIFMHAVQVHALQSSCYANFYAFIIFISRCYVVAK